MTIRATHRTLLSRLLPDDEADDLAVRQGQFHTVALGSSHVVCLPRTRAAARLPGRAASLRTLVGLGLGFRTPEPLLQGGAHGTGEVPFLVLSRIPGEPLEAGALCVDGVVTTVAAQYAALLSSLARAGSDARVRAALPRVPEGRWRRFAEGVRAELLPLMSDSGRLRAERELTALEGLPHLTHAVVHGDLGPKNVLWKWTHGLPRMSGVLDWDDVALGDPAEDLAAIGAGHGSELLERVLTPAGRPDRGLRTRIATIRGTFALQQALCAIRDGDEEELADGLTGYR